MTTIRALITRYPVPTYVALTFALSWGGVLIVVGPDGIPGTSEQLETLFPFAFLAMLVGPSVAGVLLTGVVYRKPGFRDVLSRLLEWRVAPQWYAVALLTAPLLMTATLFGFPSPPRCSSLASSSRATRPPSCWQVSRWGLVRAYSKS